LVWNVYGLHSELSRLALGEAEQKNGTAKSTTPLEPRCGVVGTFVLEVARLARVFPAAAMQPVRNPQRGMDKLREAQQEVKLRQGASFAWMKAAQMGGSGTRVMAQRGLRPNGGPPFTLDDLAPWARGR